MLKTKSKAFILAIENFQESFEYTKKALLDKRITYNEKNILRALLFLREGDYKLALDQIKSLHFDNDELIKAISFLVLGMILNNQSNFPLALTKYKMALKTIPHYDYPKTTFTLYYNFFITNYNCHNLRGMNLCLSFFKKFHFTNNRQIACYQFCLFSKNLKTENISEAEENIVQLEKLKSSMNPALLLAYLIHLFTFYIKIDQNLKAKNILHELKKIKRFKISGNFKYMTTLLNFLIDHSPIYVYENDYLDSKILYNQAMVLKFLQEKNFSKALKFWEELNRNDPAIFGNNFTYDGDKNLFSICLNRLKADFSKNLSTQQKPNEKIDLAFSILENNPQGINKHHFYEMIYNKPLENKNESLLLSKLIYKMKKKFGCRVRSFKNSYHIDLKKTG